LLGYEKLYAAMDAPGANSNCDSDLRIMDRYRMLMAEEGGAVEQDDVPLVQGESKRKRYKKRKGYTREEVEAIIERSGKLSRGVILRCKTRYFTDGAVIGSKKFVEAFSRRIKDSLQSDRRTRVKPMRRLRSVVEGTGAGAEKVEGGKMYSYRDLQTEVYGSSL